MSADKFLAVLKYYGAPNNRDAYLALAYAGTPPLDEDGELDPELESELPAQFRRAALLDTPSPSDEIQ